LHHLPLFFAATELKTNNLRRESPTEQLLAAAAGCHGGGCSNQAPPTQMYVTCIILEREGVEERILFLSKLGELLISSPLFLVAAAGAPSAAIGL
jgi:hypothetical protein